MLLTNKFPPRVRTRSILKKHGHTVLRPFDSLDSDYTINENGHIRNDFAALNESQNSYQMAVALSRLKEAVNDGLPDNISFEDAVARIRPRWCQSPAELDRFEQYCIDNALDLYRSLKENTDEDVKQAVGASVQKQDTPLSAAPVES